MKSICALGISKLKDMVGEKVAWQQGPLMCCKTILCVTDCSNVVFDDYGELTYHSLNNGKAKIYRLRDVQELLLEKE